MDIKTFVGVDVYGRRPDGTEVSHEDKYAAVVNAVGLDTLTPLVPATKEEVQAALQEDKHLNNIPLRKWEASHARVANLLKGIGITYISLSEVVCTLKQAARMWARS